MRVAKSAELVNERSQDGECGRLLAALLFGKQCGQRLQDAADAAGFERDGFPMRMVFQHGKQHLAKEGPPLVQRIKEQAASAAHHFQGRANGGDIPTGVAPWILVARGKIEAAPRFQPRQQVFHAIGERNRGESSRDDNAAWGSEIAAIHDGCH